MGSSRADRCRRAADKPAAIPAGGDRSTRRAPGVLASGHRVFANIVEHRRRRSTRTPVLVVALLLWRREARPAALLGSGVYPAGPHPTGVIWRKVDATFVPERYARSMFSKRARHKLVAWIAERSRR